MQTNRPRDNDGRFLPEDKDMANKVRCPECGKVLPVEDIRKTHFCGMVCETNYRYRMKHKDLLTGKTLSSSDVRVW
jgi:hypothetical protein